MVKVAFDKIVTDRRLEMIKWCTTKFGQSQPDPKGLIDNKRWTHDSVGPKTYFFFNQDICEYLSSDFSFYLF